MTKITAQTADIQRTVLKIKDRLGQAAIDEIVPHDELRALIPRELRNLTHYIFVARAQRLLNAETGAVFATIRGEGYRRLTNAVGADYSSNVALMRIRGQSRRGQKIATLAIRFANDITDVEKRRVYQKLSSLGLIEHLTMRKSVDRMPEDTPATDSLAGLRLMIDNAAK